MSRNVSGKKLARSSLVVGLDSVLRVATGIFIAPLLLSQVGLEGYGVWALLFSISGTVGATTGSISLAYTKFTAEYAGEDYDRLAALLGSGVLMISGITAAGCGIVWLLKKIVLESLGVTGPLLQEAETGLGWVLGGIFVRLSIGCYRKVLAGLQRTDLTFQARIVASLVYFSLALPLLYQGYGIPGLGFSFFAGEFAASLLAIFQVKRIDRALRISLTGASFSGMKSFFALGSRFQLLRLLNQVGGTGFSMLLSALLGPAMLGAYELAKRLISLGETASGAIIAPMMPAFAALHASQDETAARRLYEGGSRLLFVAALISLGFLAVFAERALMLWTGEAQVLSAWTIQLLAISYVVNPLTGMGTSSLRGRGLVGLEMSTTALSIGLHALFLAPLYYFWSYQGFVVAEVAAGVVGTFVFLWLFSRTDSLSSDTRVSEMLWRPVLVMAPVIGLAALASPWLHVDIPAFSARWDIFVELLIAGIIFTLASAAACGSLLLRREERAALLSRLVARDADTQAA